MKKYNVLFISFLCLFIFASQSHSLVGVPSNNDKSVSGLAAMIMPFVAANNTTMTIGIISSNGYSSPEDWKTYICPALKQAGATLEFRQFVAYTMGFAKTPKNKLC